MKTKLKEILSSLHYGHCHFTNYGQGVCSCRKEEVIAKILELFEKERHRMEYKFVYGSLDFEDKVNEAIKEGWKPQGGVCVKEDDKDMCIPFIFYQAMVRWECS